MHLILAYYRSLLSLDRAILLAGAQRHKRSNKGDRTYRLDLDFVK